MGKEGFSVVLLFYFFFTILLLDYSMALWKLQWEGIKINSDNLKNLSFSPQKIIFTMQLLAVSY